jgi:DNA gyrase subunit A
MSKNKDYKPEDIAYPEQAIVNSELVHEMTSSYIEYAMSVIVGRALPDVRDGLKPVHRRILYAMYEDGLTRDKPYRKCATAVGDVLGRYHPHGDASVYDALVRLAQDFSMRYPLIDGHGNFGSVDGDPPAAYRYTEARMARMAEEMLRDIDKDTVDWDPNFDETRQEPRVLPSRFPNLLVNGSNGIAVGMATNIPPHNLTEVINACVCVLDNPDATLDDLMGCISGPDFPTRGIIMGKSGIRQAYATGRGKILVRARTEMEEYGKDKRTRIIVTELPYQVNKRMLIASIADLVKEKRLEGISDLRDETDRNGMRIVVELKRDAVPQVVLNHLLTLTQLQVSFSINMLALVDNQSQPKILSLRHILDEYLKYQEEIIVRRTKIRSAQGAGARPSAGGPHHRPGQHRRGRAHHPQQLRQRQAEPYGAFRSGRHPGPGHLRHAPHRPAGPEPGEAGGRVQGSGEKIAYYKELLADPEKIKAVLGPSSSRSGTNTATSARPR